MTLGQSTYQIVVEDGLTRWATWFESLTVADDEKGHSHLIGPLSTRPLCAVS
jgi:hypothetical protein